METSTDKIELFVGKVSKEFRETNLSHDEFIEYVKKTYGIDVIIKFMPKAGKYGLQFNYDDIKNYLCP